MQINICILPGKIPTWTFQNIFSSSKCNAFCIHCPDRPCFSYGRIFKEKVTEFPVDTNVGVCPTGALTWNESAQIPSIFNDKCILCGSCLARCPAKCLYVKDDQIHINSEPIQVKNPSYLRKLLNFASIRGWYIRPNKETISLILNKIMIAKRLNPNILVRNILLSLGWYAISYKEGVQSSTMDVLAWKDGISMAAEVEFNNLIDTPRNLIAYLPLLVTRHHWNPEFSVLLAVGLSLPRRREEFWNVAEDVCSILGIKIRVVSVVSLICCVLTRLPLHITPGSPFPAIFARRPTLLTSIPPGYLGIFEPEK